MNFVFFVETVFSYRLIVGVRLIYIVDAARPICKILQYFDNNIVYCQMITVFTSKSSRTTYTLLCPISTPTFLSLLHRSYSINATRTIPTPCSNDASFKTVISQPSHYRYDDDPSLDSSLCSLVVAPRRASSLYTITSRYLCRDHVVGISAFHNSSVMFGTLRPPPQTSPSWVSLVSSLPFSWSLDPRPHHRGLM